MEEKVIIIKNDGQEEILPLIERGLTAKRSWLHYMNFSRSQPQTVMNT